MLLDVVMADFKSVFRRLDELVFILVAGVAAGVLGSFAGRLAVFLAAFLTAQLASYLFIIRDWDRGVLEGLVYYMGFGGVYLSKLVVVSAVAGAATAAAAVFIDVGVVLFGVLASLYVSTASVLGALFAVYGGLPPPAASAMSIVFSLPGLIRMAEVGLEPYLFISAVALGYLVSLVFDRV